MTPDVSPARSAADSDSVPKRHPVREEWVAPCAEACPIGIDLPRLLADLRSGDPVASLSRLLDENPLPGCTGRLCDHPCERACHRCGFDEAVSVRSIERMLGDLAAEPAFARENRRSHASDARVAVVGAGPAGLSAAWHLVRLGHDVELFDDQSEPGGWLRWGVPEFRLPTRVLAAELARIESAGVIFRSRIRVGSDLTWEELSSRFAAVVVATGAGHPKSLGMDGEEGIGILTAGELLRRVRLGDAPTLGHRVAIAGDGPEGLDAARTVRRLGGEAVVVTRGTVLDFDAPAELIDAARREGVLFSAQATPERVRLSDRLFTGLECFATEQGDGRRYFLAADTLVVAAGEERDPGLFPAGLEASPRGLTVDRLGTSSRPGLFAAGGTVGTRDLASAIGSGKRAALGVDRAIRAAADEVPPPPEAGLARFGPGGNLSAAAWRGDALQAAAPPSGQVVPFDHLETSAFPHARRHPDRRLPVERTLQTFDEVEGGLPREVAIREAGRCFVCGHCTGCETCLVFCPEAAVIRSPDGRGFAVDEAHCRGCGICRAECPRGCITLFPADGEGR